MSIDIIFDIFPLVINQIVKEYLKPFPFLKEINSYIPIIPERWLQHVLIFPYGVAIYETIYDKHQTRMINIAENGYRSRYYLKYGFCLKCSESLGWSRNNPNVEKEIWHSVGYYDYCMLNKPNNRQKDYPRRKFEYLPKEPTK